MENQINYSDFTKIPSLEEPQHFLITPQTHENIQSSTKFDEQLSTLSTIECRNENNSSTLNDESEPIHSLKVKEMKTDETLSQASAEQSDVINRMVRNFYELES